MDEYGREDKQMLKTKMEKWVPTPVIVDYVLRKILLGLILVNLWSMRQASKVYDFHYEATVSDRVEWDWEVKEYFTGWHARVEKRD